MDACREVEKLAGHVGKLGILVLLGDELFDGTNHGRSEGTWSHLENRCLHAGVGISQQRHLDFAALLARDSGAVAGMYAVPSLILFPGNAIPVSDTKQTEAFFASAWGQYEGVESADSRIAIMGEAPGTVWADVTWSYNGQPQERFCYQLVAGDSGYQIAVLTPLG